MRQMSISGITPAGYRANVYVRLIRHCTVELLAVSAMARGCARRVCLGCVPHRAAEAAAFDLHLDPLALSPSRLKAERVLTIRRAPIVAKINFVVSRTERTE